jgi:hypothetical protein
MTTMSSSSRPSHIKAPPPHKIKYDASNYCPILLTALQFRSWVIAAHSMAQLIRSMSRYLWRPSVEAEGIAFSELSSIVVSLLEWRHEHLVKVGVPSDFRADWDFVAAVSACSSDAQYHVVWVILYNAVEEFGIRELNEAQSPEGSATNTHEAETLKAKVYEEAVHGAARIAALVRTSLLASSAAHSLSGWCTHL